MLYEPMKRVARLHVDLSSSMFGVSMLYSFLDEQDYEEDRPEAPELEVTDGKIEFRDVVFGYRPGKPSLHSISFVAEAGKTTALVGRSGGGKSTVMNLIMRLYEIGSGQILCDGQDIATVSLTSLRRQIAYVSQENFLFKGSVRDNIAMGRPGASEEEIVAAAKAAYAHDFIMGFERGYDFAMRRARHATVGRAASAHRHRPRVFEGRADHPFGRGDFGARFRNPSRRSRWRCAPYAKGARQSSSPTGCRRSRKPTRSASSTAAGSSSAAGTANSWRKGAPTATSLRRSFPREALSQVVPLRVGA